ncbi:hypothetical protein GQ44DRAFT_161835 [Phaeosphaeriaceae sp. PMI808]|nr:hypothetical protein GQ44DRAFT_161835 [Phaeosphaeriaceae sp. PMI808]
MSAAESFWRQITSPLLDQAWVYQEIILTKRTLYIGSSELTWECNSLLACECTGIRKGIDSILSMKARFAKVCRNQVSEKRCLICGFI